MADEQLLTKQVIANDMNSTGQTTSVGFQLPRGKVARIWGFNWALAQLQEVNREYSVFVRKTANSPRQDTPKDILWVQFVKREVSGAAWAIWHTQRDIIFPKPHRTVGLTVQMHASSASTTNGVLVIYYDIDDMKKGEATQVLEKSVLRGRSRRTSEFD